jgi:DNA-binding beta-propeller fold protein YncE
MQFNTINIRSLAACALILGLNACKSTSEPEPSQPYDTGVFVINRGNFFDNNGSISLINSTTKALSFDIFQTENVNSLAGGVSDYAEIDGKGIILVDNATAGKDAIEIVNARTFKSVAKIPSSDLENPRYVAKAGTNKAYVTCWDSFNADYSYKPGYVLVIDLTTNKVIKKIAVQKGANKLLVVGNEAIVATTTYSDATTISIIDTQADAIKQTVEIGYEPQLIGADANGKIWLYADGKFVKFNLISKAVESRIAFASPSSIKSAGSFTFNKEKTAILFAYSYADAADNYKQKGETYSFGINDSSVLTTKPVINKVFSGLTTDPNTGNIYAGFSPSLKQAGYVFRYQANGTLIDSLKAGIGPEGFLFK